MIKERNAYWDNLKVVLIFLVVLGHFWVFAQHSSEIVITAYTWIYLFHMPAFAFVSGYFSQGYVKKQIQETKLVGFLSLYILLTVGIWSANAPFGKTIQFKEIIDTVGAPWYMLAMFFWYLAIPFVSKLKKRISFPIFICLGLLVGFYPSCGSFLSLSKTIALFPFFLAGFHFGKRFPKTICGWKKIISAIFLVVCFLFIYFFRDAIGNGIQTIYADKSYSFIGIGSKLACMYRLIWYVVAMAMTISVMCLIPEKRFVFTSIGERTLSVYVIHRILRDVFLNLGLYQYFNTTWLQLVGFIVISAAMVYITSARPLSNALNKLFNLKFFFSSSVEENS